MPDVPEDEAREHRIHDEIIVDAYDPEEQALGWYDYLEQALDFPFRARCVRERAMSPLQVGEDIEVVGMPPEEDCGHEMFVLIRWQGRQLAVPLSQLEGIAVNEETAAAIANWQYGVARGYQL
jgi:hypothetical protein